MPVRRTVEVTVGFINESDIIGTMIKVNRAPVLTLWAAVVAERLGFKREEALTLGRAVAGLSAQSKGRRLGIFNPNEEKTEEARKRTRNEEFYVEIFGRSVPAVNTEGGVRATEKGKPMQPDSVERYLTTKFGAALPEVEQAMSEVAKSYSPDELGRQAFALYEKFRPAVPEGTKGWGAQGNLDLEQIRGLRK